jgi:hypothetical protein
MGLQDDVSKIADRLEECALLLREQARTAKDWRVALRNGVLTGVGAFLGATVGAALVVALLRPLLEPIGLERVVREMEKARGDRPPVAPAPGPGRGASGAGGPEPRR